MMKTFYSISRRWIYEKIIVSVEVGLLRANVFRLGIAAKITSGTELSDAEG